MKIKDDRNLTIGIALAGFSIFMLIVVIIVEAFTPSTQSQSNTVPIENEVIETQADTGTEDKSITSNDSKEYFLEGRIKEINKGQDFYGFSIDASLGVGAKSTRKFIYLDIMKVCQELAKTDLPDNTRINFRFYGETLSGERVKLLQAETTMQQIRKQDVEMLGPKYINTILSDIKDYIEKYY